MEKILNYLLSIIGIIPGTFALISEYYPMLVSNSPRITLLSYFIFLGIIIAQSIFSLQQKEKLAYYATIFICFYGLIVSSIRFCLYLVDDFLNILMIISCSFALFYFILKVNKK